MADLDKSEVQVVTLALAELALRRPGWNSVISGIAEHLDAGPLYDGLRALGVHQAVGPRPSWDAYFLDMAKLVSTRATCHRASVGVVVVGPDHRVRATGYNGAPAGMPHCPDDEDLSPDAHCPRSRHAELNVVEYAERVGISLEGCTWHMWPFGPCPPCQPLVAATQPSRVVAPVSFADRFIYQSVR